MVKFGEYYMVTILEIAILYDAIYGDINMAILPYMTILTILSDRHHVYTSLLPLITIISPSCTSTLIPGFQAFQRLN